MPFELAALFGCAVLTGVGAVVNTAKVEPGQSVAVVGLGGVGLSAVLGAKLAGARQIVAVDTSAERLAFAARLGATDAVNAGADGPVEAVRRSRGEASTSPSTWPARSPRSSLLTQRPREAERQ